MSEHLRRWGIGLATVVTLAAAACTSSPPDVPPGPTSAVPPPRLGSSAPAVARSWDTSAYRDKPCALFTDDQARVLGYNKPGSVYMGQPGVANCMRIGETSDADFTVMYYFDTDMLGKIYRREILFPGINSASPITIAGQPALRPNIPGAPVCTVAVGLTSTQGFEVRISDKTTDPCDRAVHVADVIMRNLGA